MPTLHREMMTCEVDSEFRVPQLRKSAVSSWSCDRRSSALSTGSFTFRVEVR